MYEGWRSGAIDDEIMNVENIDVVVVDDEDGRRRVKRMRKAGRERGMQDGRRCFDGRQSG
jgi:hypothetical protein